MTGRVSTSSALLLNKNASPSPTTTPATAGTPRTATIATAAATSKKRVAFADKHYAHHIRSQSLPVELLPSLSETTATETSTSCCPLLVALQQLDDYEHFETEQQEHHIRQQRQHIHSHRHQHHHRRRHHNTSHASSAASSSSSSTCSPSSGSPKSTTLPTSSSLLSSPQSVRDSLLIPDHPSPKKTNRRRTLSFPYCKTRLTSCSSISSNMSRNNSHDGIADGDIGQALYPVVQDLTLIEYGGGGRRAAASAASVGASGIAGCCAFDSHDYDIVEVVAHGTMSLLDLSLPSLDIHLQHQRHQHQRSRSLTNKDSTCGSSMDDTRSSSNPFSSLSRSNSTGTGTGVSATAARQKFNSSLHLRRESSSSSSSSSSNGLLKMTKPRDQRHARTLSNTSLANTSAATATTSAATFLHSNHSRHHHHYNDNDFPHDEVDNDDNDDEEEVVDKDQHRATIETDPNETTSTSSSTKQAQATSPPPPPSPSMQERTFDHDYVLTRQIWECSVSTIWECVHRTSGIRFCVKIYDFSQLVDPDEQEAIMQECRVLQSVQSSHDAKQQDHNNAASIVKLVKIYGCNHDPHVNTKGYANSNNTATTSSSEYTATTQNIHIVMELATSGNLQSRVLQHGPLSEDRVKTIAVDLLQGVLHLQQSHRLCHVNLQPCNVLLHNDGVVNPVVGKRRKSSTSTTSSSTSTNTMPGLRAVICDFGSVCRINGVVSRLPHELHMQFAAPEIVQHQTCNGVTDMWSIGAILYFCLFGTLPPVITGDGNNDDASAGNRNGNNMFLCSYSRMGTWDFTFPTSMPPTTSGNSPQRASSLTSSQAIEQLESHPEESASLPPPPSPQQDHTLVPLVSRQAKQLISACLHSDPTVRLTPEEALAHPWLADVLAARSSSIKGKNGGNCNKTSRRRSRRRRWLGRVVLRRPWSLLCSISNNAHGQHDDDNNNQKKKDLDLTAASTTESSPYREQQYPMQHHHQPCRRHSDHKQIDRRHHQNHQGNHYHNGNHHASHSDGKKGNQAQSHRAFTPPRPPPPASPTTAAMAANLDGSSLKNSVW